jgi:hypothetical protein
LDVNSYSLKITDGKVNAHLPYFGREHSARSYGKDGGIEIDNVFSDCELEFYDSKRVVTIRCASEGESEKFDIILEVQKNGKARLIVNSVHRSSIHYHGEVFEIKSNISL